jgi:hypothetical protein
MYYSTHQAVLKEMVELQIIEEVADESEFLARPSKLHQLAALEWMAVQSSYSTSPRRLRELADKQCDQAICSIGTAFAREHHAGRWGGLGAKFVLLSVEGALWKHIAPEVAMDTAPALREQTPLMVATIPAQ